MKKISCAYCNGTGMDPFELPSKLSRCIVCDGTGGVEVKEPLIACVFCAGTGKNPLGSRIPCIVCLGKGSNYCESTTICDQCQGTGKSTDNLPCTLCRGTGFTNKKASAV